MWPFSFLFVVTLYSVQWLHALSICSLKGIFGVLENSYFESCARFSANLRLISFVVASYYKLSIIYSYYILRICTSTRIA